MSGPRACAVALHDVEPATYRRCAEIRRWLEERGVDRVTLLVIPARDLHRFDRRSPELLRWLKEREAHGDAIAQHGFRHLRGRRAGIPRRWVARVQGGRSAEFPGLDREATRSAVATGSRILAAAGMAPRGFVAPAYAYTPALRRELDGRFDWWAGLVRVHGGGRRRGVTAPAHGFGASTRTKRLISPLTARLGSRLSGRVLRVDVHPADFDHPRHVRALDAMLTHARGRSMVTYDELFGG